MSYLHPEKQPYDDKTLAREGIAMLFSAYEKEEEKYIISKTPRSF